MTTIDPQDMPRPNRVTRAFYAIPVVGWVARDLTEGGTENIYYLLVALLCLLVVSVMTWGIVALTVAALAMVPVIFTLLIWITWG